VDTSTESRDSSAAAAKVGYDGEQNDHERAET
jgi:hypothetical protein